MWAVAQENFKKSFSDYLAFFGVVPREEHLELVKKYEGLKEKCESQEETIRHLRMLLSQSKREEFQDLAGHFEELVRKQGDQFQKLMETFSKPFDKEDSSREA
jgi:cobyrinic acid a,c-diamide synthase